MFELGSEIAMQAGIMQAGILMESLLSFCAAKRNVHHSVTSVTGAIICKRFYNSVQVCIRMQVGWNIDTKGLVNDI